MGYGELTVISSIVRKFFRSQTCRIVSLFYLGKTFGMFVMHNNFESQPQIG